MAGVARILGIDPGTRYCGYGVIERVARRTRPLHRVRRASSPSARARWRRGSARSPLGLVEIIDELEPDVVAVEGVFHGVNARSALQLGHCRGVALATAGARALHRASSTRRRRSSARSPATAQATKDQVQAMVRALCGLKRAPKLDASDALAVAICHAFRAATRLQVGR